MKRAEVDEKQYLHMRASRAYIAGFGTTSVLVASALLLLAVVSALVAFKGWPGTVSANIESLVVDEPERIEVDGPAQVALGAASAAAAVAGSPAPGTAAAGGPSASAGISVADVRLPPEASTVGPPSDPDGGARFRDDNTDTGRQGGPPNPPANEPRGGLLPETPLSPQVNRLTDGLSDTTEGLTDGLGYTVGRLNPQLGGTLTDTGRVVAELLRGLGRPAR